MLSDGLSRIVTGFFLPISVVNLFSDLENGGPEETHALLPQFVFETIFNVVRLLLSMFVFVSSVICLFLVRRSSSASLEKVFGLAKMLVFSSILFAANIIYFVYRTLDNQTPTRTYGFPFAFEYGFISIGLQVSGSKKNFFFLSCLKHCVFRIIYADLLYLVIEATRILRLRSSQRYTELEMESMENISRKEPLIPLRYEI